MDEVIKGYILSYIYKNEENGYKIAKILKEDETELVVVGYFPLLNEDTLYEFHGKTVVHPRFGSQFQVTSFTQVEDLNEKGLVTFLSSDEFDGIGPITAKRIIDLLGLDALDKILEDENVLSPILNEKRRKKLKEQLITNKSIHNIYIKLFEYGISNKIAHKLYKEYGDSTIIKLKEDPFRLMDDIYGFGFLKSYDLALKLGFMKDDLITIKAAIIYILKNNAYSTGNLYLNLEELTTLVNKLLKEELELKEALNELVKEAKIIIKDKNYFLREIYQEELDLSIEIKRINEGIIKDIDTDLLNNYLIQFSLQNGITYTETQKKAILDSLKKPFTIITGGPGTGKTTLIEGIINLYSKYYNFSLKDSKALNKIALMAPTGRASKRMKEILEFDAKTIHRHLGYDYDNNYKKNKFDQLEQDLIIIDEASMIDIFIAKRLFEAIKTNTQVIIVGDEDQLPSVGPGNVLGDLIASNIIPVIRLKEIHRQAKDSYIVKFASLVNEQKLTKEDLVSHEDVIFYNGNTNDIKRVILNQIKGALNKGYSLLEDIQVLIPFYKGDLGIDVMNKEIQKMFNPSYLKSKSMSYGDKTYYENDKVIQLVNNSDNGIMNGDIGVIKSIFLDNNEKLTMQIEFDDSIVLYNQSDLDNINLAYVISIHKSQGSEYKIVFMPIIRSYLHMLKKELIYTAITRSKEYLLILGDMSLLTFASNQLEDKRKTYLIKHLTNNYEELNLFQEEDPFEDLSPYDLMDD